MAGIAGPLRWSASQPSALSSNSYRNALCSQSIIQRNSDAFHSYCIQHTCHVSQSYVGRGGNNSSSLAHRNTCPGINGNAIFLFFSCHVYFGDTNSYRNTLTNSCRNRNPFTATQSYINSNQFANGDTHYDTDSNSYSFTHTYRNSYAWNHPHARPFAHKRPDSDPVAFPYSSALADAQPNATSQPDANRDADYYSNPDAFARPTANGNLDALTCTNSDTASFTFTGGVRKCNSDSKNARYSTDGTNSLVCSFTT